MDYAGLQSSVLNWAARSDAASTTEVANCIAFATDGFNYGVPARGIVPLRVREMETLASITMTDGVGTLPDDYLQYKTARSMSSLPNPLSYATGSYTNGAYADGAAGLSTTFSITGSTIYVFPTSGVDVDLVYYAAIPTLSDVVTSNWLLAKMPNLYLHASLMHLAMFIRDAALLANSQAMVAAMIDGLNITNELSTYAKAGTRMSFLTP
ncbi:hypothetical protein HLI01_22205 [Rhizobium laguerreae]|uniref:phage adaptor protein n=1 Tax=Rhizobium laguerreae TaxID=1076926 RepID=UPI0014787E08|nr:hypothetical protein [Rhizobium laguerreae]NNH59451.1 hypothetical protein [Rhizobium laguerreae]